MKIQNKYLTLPEGHFYTNVQVFDSTDDQTIRDIYNEWRSLTNKLTAIHARGVNMPEGLSEPVFCRAMNCVRITASIPGANTSFDAFDLKANQRIQVKACSVLPDLTSFGPKSQWDRLYFMDFYRQGLWDGTVDIYLIPNDLIYNYPVNAGQTLRDQQEQGRRPRFSIYTGIIQRHGIAPVKTYTI